MKNTVKQRGKVVAKAKPSKAVKKKPVKKKVPKPFKFPERIVLYITKSDKKYFSTRTYEISELAGFNFCLESKLDENVSEEEVTIIGRYKFEEQDEVKLVVPKPVLEFASDVGEIKMADKLALKK